MMPGPLGTSGDGILIGMIKEISTVICGERAVKSTEDWAIFPRSSNLLGIKFEYQNLVFTIVPLTH